MKMFKKVSAVVSAALLCASAAFAADGTDGIYKASASTVENDSVKFMNLLDWNDLSMKIRYGIVAIDADNMGNAGYAYKRLNTDQIHLFWEGNLWEDNAYNNLQAMYGTKNMAFTAGYTHYNYSFDEIPGDTINFALNAFNAGFGMNVNKKLGFTAGLSYAGGDANEIDLSIFDFNAGLRYKITEDKTMTSKVGAYLTGDFVTAKAGPFKTNINETVLGAWYSLNYKLSQTFTYGFYGNVPFAFAGGDADGTMISFNLRNGFVAQVKPTVQVAAGIDTNLPSLTFVDGDTYKGDYSNAFYAGFGIQLSPEFKFDASAKISPASHGTGDDGVSLNDVWEQRFILSIVYKK